MLLLVHWQEHIPPKLLADSGGQSLALSPFPVDDEGLAGRPAEVAQPAQDFPVIRVRGELLERSDFSPHRD